MSPQTEFKVRRQAKTCEQLFALPVFCFKILQALPLLQRMVLIYVLQVILKPDPGNPQELYLGSLKALGIDTKQHDIRFVEDNWENPALGAWGLGWEVWLDGEPLPNDLLLRVSSIAL